MEKRVKFALLAGLVLFSLGGCCLRTLFPKDRVFSYCHEDVYQRLATLFPPGQIDKIHRVALYEAVFAECARATEKIYNYDLVPAEECAEEFTRNEHVFALFVLETRQSDTTRAFPTLFISHRRPSVGASREAVTIYAGLYDGTYFRPSRKYRYLDHELKQIDTKRSTIDLQFHLERRSTDQYRLDQIINHKPNWLGGDKPVVLGVADGFNGISSIVFTKKEFSWESVPPAVSKTAKP